MRRWVLAVLLLLMAAGVAGAADAWQSDTDIVSGLVGVDEGSRPTVFEKDGTWYLITGDEYGAFYGYNWAGSEWQSDSVIVSGLVNVGNCAAPTVFQKDSTWYLITGEYYGDFYGYNWTGSTWQSDSVIVGGLGSVGYRSTPTVFQKDSTWYLIAGEEDGVFNGYNWDGSIWQSDGEIASGLVEEGEGEGSWCTAPTVFRKDSVWYLITGEEYGAFYGYNWAGSTWQSDSTIICGIGAEGGGTTPTVFEKDGAWHLITGERNGGFTGYVLAVATWQIDSEIASGLEGEGSHTAPTVFQKDSVWYLITGEEYGAFYGYNWAGSTWQSDSGIVSGLGGGEAMYSTPAVFQMDGTWYLITGEEYGAFYGYSWTGSTWQSDSGIVSGLGGDEIMYSALTVFLRDGTWCLIFGVNMGECGSTLYGFTWTGSEWQSDGGVVSGIGDVGNYPKPTVFQKDSTWYLLSGGSEGVFDGFASSGGSESVPTNLAHVKGKFWVNHTWAAGSGSYEIDSYNVSINGTWHNSTINTHYNNTLTIYGDWSNITVYAYNNSGGVSGGSVSEDVQLPYLTPPTPAGTGSTWDYYWVNHSWAEGSSYGLWCGDTDSYNVSITTFWSNGTYDSGWTNGSSTTWYNNILTTPGGSMVRVYAFNATGGLNDMYIYQSVEIPHYPPATPTNLQNTSGSYGVNHTWDTGYQHQVIIGEEYGEFTGYRWTGTSWQSDGDSISGLVGVGRHSTPTIFSIWGKRYLISGDRYGGFHGYNWTGTSWQIDNNSINGLVNAMYTVPTGFKIGNKNYLIVGTDFDGYEGYEWDAVLRSWVANSDIITEIGGAEGGFTAITVFSMAGAVYAVTGEVYGQYHGYDWDGSQWQYNSTMGSGLVDPGYSSKPNAFCIDGEYYLISGSRDGAIDGYKWGGSQWQTNNTIVGGLPAINHASISTYRKYYTTDSYNVSIEGDGWHNGTVNPWYVDPLGSSGWSNSTIYAFNNTGGLSDSSVGAAVYVPSQLGDVCINQTGWWSLGGMFHASGTPLQDGLNNMAEGTGAYVYNGSYTESVTISTAHTTITTEGKDVVNIASPSGSHCINVNADYVTLSGFEVSGATSTYHAGVYVQGQHYCNISDMDIHGNRIGLYLDGGSYRNCTDIGVYSNSGDGIYAKSSTHDTFTNCALYSNARGINTYQGSHHICVNMSAYSNHAGDDTNIYGTDNMLFDSCSISNYQLLEGAYDIVIRDHALASGAVTLVSGTATATVMNTLWRVFAISGGIQTTAYPNGTFTTGVVTNDCSFNQYTATLIPHASSPITIYDFTYNNDVFRNETSFNANYTNVDNAFWMNITKESWTNSTVCEIVKGTCTGDAWVGADGVLKYHYTGGFDTDTPFVFRPHNSGFVQHPIELSHTKGYPAWVNWTWDHESSACCWLKADSYNTSVRGTWHNTTDAFYNDTGFEWDVPLDIVVYTYNDTYTTLSIFNVADSTFLPTPNIGSWWNNYTNDTALILEHILHTTLPITINFSVTSSDPVPEWVWTGVDTVYNGTNSTTSNASKTFTEFGTFDVSVIGTYELGGQTSTTTWTVATDLQWIGEVSVSVDQCSGWSSLSVTDTDYAPVTYPYGVIYYVIHYLWYDVWTSSVICRGHSGDVMTRITSGATSSESTSYVVCDEPFGGAGGVWWAGSVGGTDVGTLTMYFHKYHYGGAAGAGSNGKWFETKQMNATVYAYSTDGIREVSGAVSCVDNVTLYRNMSDGMIGYLAKDKTHLDGAYSFHTANGIDYVLEFVSDAGYSVYKDFTGSMINQTIDFNACRGQYIVLKDGSGNLIQNAKVAIFDKTDSVYVHKWKTDADGILNFSAGDYSNHTLLIVVNTFDGVFMQEVYFGPKGDLTNITIPLNYNLRIHPEDQTGTPLTDVFCGLSEYTPLNPQSFWGMSMSGHTTVPVGGCSGFAMCDIVAEKPGYADYNMTALNWTSQTAMIKDYRHDAVMEPE